VRQQQPRPSQSCWLMPAKPVGSGGTVGLGVGGAVAASGAGWRAAAARQGCFCCIEYFMVITARLCRVAGRSPQSILGPAGSQCSAECACAASAHTNANKRHTANVGVRCILFQTTARSPKNEGSAGRPCRLIKTYPRRPRTQLINHSHAIARNCSAAQGQGTASSSCACHQGSSCVLSFGICHAIRALLHFSGAFWLFARQGCRHSTPPDRAAPRSHIWSAAAPSVAAGCICGSNVLG
jgi:hypothetical protein